MNPSRPRAAEPSSPRDQVAEFGEADFHGVLRDAAGEVPQSWAERRQAVEWLVAHAHPALGACPAGRGELVLRRALLLAVAVVQAEAGSELPRAIATVAGRCKEALAGQLRADATASPQSLREPATTVCSRLGIDQDGTRLDDASLVTYGHRRLLAENADHAAGLAVAVAVAVVTHRRRIPPALRRAVRERLAPLVPRAREHWDERADLRDGSTPGDSLSALIGAIRACQGETGADPFRLAPTSTWLAVAGGCISAAERYAVWFPSERQRADKRFQRTPPAEEALTIATSVLARSDIMNDTGAFAADAVLDDLLANAGWAAAAWLREATNRRRAPHQPVTRELVPSAALALVGAWASEDERTGCADPGGPLSRPGSGRHLP